MAVVCGSVISIVGPTASGKSSLADRVALNLASEVVSVDALQIYKGMDIGTAKIPEKERKAPLHMVDVSTIDEMYSVKKFQSQARFICSKLINENKVPVLCGGTGLYLNAVVEAMEFPEEKQSSYSRDYYQQYLEENGPDKLHQLLALKDSRAAEIIHPNNSVRVIRALEMTDEGKSYGDTSGKLFKLNHFYMSYTFVLNWPRDLLYDRINMRVDMMFDQGLVKEVEELCEAGLRDGLTSKQAIGYKEIIDYFDGVLTLDEARELIKKRTRNYAKRQLTWFRKLTDAKWIDLSRIPEADALAYVLNNVPHSQY